MHCVAWQFWLFWSGRLVIDCDWWNYALDCYMSWFALLMTSFMSLEAQEWWICIRLRFARGVSVYLPFWLFVYLSDKKDLSPSEEWHVDQQLLAKLKEQYKKERQKGKKGIQSRPSVLCVSLSPVWNSKKMRQPLSREQFPCCHSNRIVLPPSMIVNGISGSSPRGNPASRKVCSALLASCCGA